MASRVGGSAGEPSETACTACYHGKPCGGIGRRAVEDGAHCMLPWQAVGEDRPASRRRRRPLHVNPTACRGVIRNRMGRASKRQSADSIEQSSPRLPVASSRLSPYGRPTPRQAVGLTCSGRRLRRLDAQNQKQRKLRSNASCGRQNQKQRKLCSSASCGRTEPKTTQATQ